MASRLCPRMHLSAVIAALLLLVSNVEAHRGADDTTYFIAVTSQAVGGTSETMCVTVNSRRPVSFTVSMELNKDTITILDESKVQDYYSCVSFKVPVVTQETLAMISLQMKGGKRGQDKSTNILVIPPPKMILIETDKPIYKPGQTVKFRIVSLDYNLYTNNRMFSTIDLRDPNSNRIGQWLNVTTSRGMVDLSFPLNARAVNGYYTITVWMNGAEQMMESFEVSDYVLPTHEVKIHVPQTITILDTRVTLKVCAKYMYGKPVSGDVKVVVCHNSYVWYLFRRPPNPDGTAAPKLCKLYDMRTDSTGCGEKTIDLANFDIANARYETWLSVDAEVEEDGTGVVLKASGGIGITNWMVRISLEDSPTVFRPGMTYEGKVKMMDPNSNPVPGRPVYLVLTYGETTVNQTVTTDGNGVALFSYETDKWGEAFVTIKAQYHKIEQQYEYNEIQHKPYYASGYIWLSPFYSRSRSYIAIDPNSTMLSCDVPASFTADYLINDKAKTLSFFYMVMSRGHVVNHGRLSVNTRSSAGEIRGSLSVPLTDVRKLSPYAQVVVYTLLSNDEVVADSMTFSVQPCLNNKVSLSFKTSPELPGAQTVLSVKAAPDSLCSVKAIDKSVVLLRPDSELTIQSVVYMMPIPRLWGFPYQVYTEEDWNPCGSEVKPVVARERRTSIWYPHYWEQSAYGAFRAIGVRLLTNAEIRSTRMCPTDSPSAKPANEVASAAGNPGGGGSAFARNKVVTVRSYFPETWIWDLVAVGASGEKLLNKTLPDSITTWQADAFCTSPIGFGVAPSTELVAFQPFFVSVTMPSSVIRGEVFTLKATVFNYLQSCIVVSVSLADSKQYSARRSRDCKYTRCLCADDSFTVSWSITPLVLGNVNISVTAEASRSSLLCGRRTVSVPTTGRKDTVIKTIRVEAEGIKHYKSYNEFLCPKGKAIQKRVSLTLPRRHVKGSAAASVSVIGDLMGRALQNLASLLAMPSGCGEQNMLLFAPNIYILQYLESTGQLTEGIRSTAQTYLVTGYQTELLYKHTDGSYSAFGMSDASGNTWLTAYVMKSFGAAMKYVFVDQLFVDQAKVWLGQQQQSNGCFASVGQLFHTDMKGGVNDEVTLSAYIVAAMLELGYSLTDPVVSKGLTCLRNSYSQVNSTYAKALLFYTFTLAGNQTMRTSLISALDAEAIVSDGGRHWSRSSDGSVTDSLEVEMTSYVLLALMSGPEMPGFGLAYSISIVQWLSQQQNAFGGYVSTQDTVVALQALAKYSQATYSPAGDVTVTVTSPSGLTNTFTINQSNRLLYQESQLQEVPGNYSVRAEGKGCVYLQFAVSYNMPSPPGNTSEFRISASAEGNCRVRNGPVVLQVNVKVMYKGTRPGTNMVVIELRPLSGFEADETSVTLVNSNSNSDGAVVLKEKVNGILVIYLNGLTKNQEYEYAVTITEAYGVDHNQPASVKVYDYYQTGESGATEYTSPCPYQ